MLAEALVAPDTDGTRRFSMSTAHEALVDVGPTSSWDLVAQATAAGIGPGVYLAHRPSAAAGDWHPSGWTVADVADPARSRQFPVEDATDGDEVLLDAITWANGRYGTTVWATVPGLLGDIFPAEVARWAAERVLVAA